MAAGLLDDLIGTILDDLPLVSGPVTLLAAVGAGYGFVRAYRHRSMLRSTLSALAVAPLGFLAWFAFATPANDLLFLSSVAAADVSLGPDLPPIVVVVFDELPLASVVGADAETIDADRFPNLARLAGDGVWYPNATSVAGYTHEAVPAILTGERVHDENLPPTPSGHPDSLFTFLADDYTITSHEELTGLCTPSLCEESTGLAEQTSFSVLLEDLGIVAGHVTLPAVLEGWLPTINDTWANFGQDPVALDQEADRLAEDRADFVEDLGQFDRVGGVPVGRGRHRGHAGAPPHLHPQRVPARALEPSRRRLVVPGPGQPRPGRQRLDHSGRAPTSACSATCCRRSSPTGSSASCSTSSRPRASTTTPSSSSPPTTVPRSRPGPTAACPPRRASRG